MDPMRLQRALRKTSQGNCNPEGPPVRILVIEDESEMADRIADALRREGHAVDVLNDGEEGLERCELTPYSLIVLDLNLPSLDGVEVCRRLRSRQPPLRILIVSARSRLTERIAGLDEGADDYLIKPFEITELKARVRALLRREFSVHYPFLAVGDLQWDVCGRIATRGGRRLALTKREAAVLEYMMRHPTAVISQEELLENVWDDRADSFTNTVRVHIASLRKKLNVGSVVPLIETVVGQGYRLISGPVDDGIDAR